MCKQLSALHGLFLELAFICLLFVVKWYFTSYKRQMKASSGNRPCRAAN